MLTVIMLCVVDNHLEAHTPPQTHNCPDARFKTRPAWIQPEVETERTRTLFIITSGDVLYIKSFCERSSRPLIPAAHTSSSAVVSSFKPPLGSSAVAAQQQLRRSTRLFIILPDTGCKLRKTICFRNMETKTRELVSNV